MRTWPKIKLVDSRGRTVTVFKRVPVLEPLNEKSRGETGEELLVDEIFDLGPIRQELVEEILGRGWQPRSQAAWDEARALIEGNFIEWLRTFYSTHGRMPGAVREHALADSAALIKTLQTMLAGHGITMFNREELTRLLRETAIESDYIIRSSCAALNKAVEVARSAGLEVVKTTCSGNFHIVGAPRGRSKWEQASKPASKKAVARAEADLDRTEAEVVAMPPGHTPEFDGVNLPAWDDVQKALDEIAVHGQVGDTLTLTVPQLWHLVQRS